MIYNCIKYSISLEMKYVRLHLFNQKFLGKNEYIEKKCNNILYYQNLDVSKQALYAHIT